MKQDRYLAVVMVAVAAYAVFFTYYTVMKHYAFRTLMFDLGIYDNMFWKLVKYGLPYPSPTGLIHNSITLYLLTPFYAIFPSPITLLVLQSITVPLAAIPLYLLAEYQLKDRKLALVVSLLFLLYPPLHGLSQFDFHVEMLLPPLLLLAIYYLHTRNWRLYIATTLAIIATMDYASYLVFMMGMYQLIVYRADLWQLINPRPFPKIVFSITSSIISGIIVMGLALASLKLSHFDYTLATPSLEAFSLQNLGVLGEMKLVYMAKLFGPLAFLPLLSLAPLLMATPWFAFIALTIEPEFLKIFNQFSAFAAPFMFVGLIATLKKIHSRKRLIIVVTLVTLSTTVYFIIATDEVAVSVWPQINEREQLLNKLIQIIPAEAGVLTQNNIGPHLTGREKIFMWPVGTPGYGPENYEEVDYILIDASQYYYYYAPVLRGYSYDATRIAVQQFLITGKYTLIFEQDGIMLYKRVD